MPEIGATLREARMRARIDVSEIEAQTKIRAKYLRALENEEWSLLPGPTFVKSFLRTYAQALELDGKALVEEYRRQYERPSNDGPLEPIVGTRRSTSAGRPRRPSGPSPAYLAAVGLAALAVVVLIVLVIVNSGGGGGHKQQTTSAGTTHAHHKAHAPSSSHKAAAPTDTQVSLSIHPTGAVYVCLIGDGGRRLIAGEELQAGQDTPTFHARRFELTLGNASVKLYIDGTPRVVKPSSEAIGYSITKARGRQPLSSSEQPTCT